MQKKHKINKTTTKLTLAHTHTELRFQRHARTQTHGRTMGQINAI